MRVERYGGKNLDQAALGREYDAARVFAVGSWFEGFCQPGLEALACGTPLVTTDNGGCREYAIDGETALVVPPRDAAGDGRCDPPPPRRRDARQELVVERSRRRRRATSTGSGGPTSSSRSSTVSSPGRRSRRRHRARRRRPNRELSVVVLAWDNLPYTQQFVESVRRHTDVPYELIIVDNGSAA